MFINASSGQVVNLILTVEEAGIITVDVDHPLISTQFSVRSSDEIVNGTNYCVLSTTNVLQFDGTSTLSLQFRIPFIEQGLDGEFDIEGITPIDFVSKVEVTGAIKSSSIEVI